MKSALFRGVSVSLPSASSRPMVDLYRLSLFFSCFHSTSSLQHPTLSRPYPMKSAFFWAVCRALAGASSTPMVDLLILCLFFLGKKKKTLKYFQLFFFPSPGSGSLRHRLPA